LARKAVARAIAAGAAAQGNITAGEALARSQATGSDLRTIDVTGFEWRLTQSEEATVARTRDPAYDGAPDLVKSRRLASPVAAIGECSKAPASNPPTIAKPAFRLS
jgi:hypothetical protein